MYYDRSNPVIVQMDASEYVLGTALIQSGHPIAFVSKMLTDIETYYVNIERECLSVCFSHEKFHTYLYSRHVIIQNEHKLLEMIQQKPIHATPSQLQHMLLCMQKYDYTIQYKPGKEMVLANYPSCFPSHKESSPIPIHQNIQHIQLSTSELDAIWGAIECNPVYSTLYHLTLRGWSDYLQGDPRITWNFWGTCDELSL